MSAWFALLGAPLAENERNMAHAYLRGLGIAEPLLVDGVRDWSEARAVVTAPAWDQRWWEAEQLEKRRLHARASAAHGEARLFESLSRTLVSSEPLRTAAATAAERSGCTDRGLVGAAAGAASETCHLAELARLADAEATHPFFVKRALFDAGRWPLGILSGAYRIF